jgi:uncharacterized membrane protein YeaQ/YmgE (transglycosylase-associated protein family)
MAFLLLVLLWFVLGLVVGALAQAARLRPVAWGRSGWFWMLLLGAGSALLGGLLDTWLAGRLFATATALWVAVLATVAPWLVTRFWVWLDGPPVVAGLWSERERSGKARKRCGEHYARRARKSWMI